MKVYISVDIDGIGSLAEMCMMSGYPPLPWVQELATREVNAATVGITLDDFEGAMRAFLVLLAASGIGNPVALAA